MRVRHPNRVRVWKFTGKSMSVHFTFVDGRLHLPPSPFERYIGMEREDFLKILRRNDPSIGCQEIR